MLRNDFVIYSKLAQMLKYFGWTWIGIIRSGDDSGSEEYSVLREVMNLYKICISFKIEVGVRGSWLRDLDEGVHSIKRGSVNVIVICGALFDFDTDFVHFIRDYVEDGTIVLSPVWAANVVLIGKHPEMFNCSLSLGAKSTSIAEFQNFVDEFQPQKKPDDKLLEDLWMMEFGCSSVDERKNLFFEYVYKRSLHECNGTERVSDIQHFFHGGNAHQVYLAVYSMAAALHDMLGFMKTSGSHLSEFNHQKLHRYIQASYYFSENTSHQYFNEDGEFVTQYVIQNHLLVNKTILTNDVGLFEQSTSREQSIFINASLIKWKNYQRESAAFTYTWYLLLNMGGKIFNKADESLTALPSEFKPSKMHTHSYCRYLEITMVCEYVGGSWVLMDHPNSHEAMDMEDSSDDDVTIQNIFIILVH
ncbi:extracellular calcium-sensing receptor-like [Lithobates pipiens]